MSMKEDFFRYLGPSESLAGYTRSYKLVFLTALIDHMDSNGKAPAEAVAGNFLLFYRERKARGLPADKDADRRIENAESSSEADALAVIMAQPWRVIHAKGFLDYISEYGHSYFAFARELVDGMCFSDWVAARALMQTKLKLYFKRLDCAPANAPESRREIDQLLLQDFRQVAEDIISGQITEEEEIDAILDSMTAFCDDTAFRKLFRSVVQAVAQDYPETAGSYSSW